ncbi:hypothetical protein Leryth_023000 [Lithospermum erythrorhizon]|nr:hypothetical protein Leryth_023000 [Lithospermum erythrorhizon]
MRRRPCCHTFLASIIKFLNFLEFFIGVCMIIYSAYMLNHWHHHHHHAIISNSLPAPWFIYGFMSVGILLCCLTCIGHIAAEAINCCCLCFYAVLSTIFILLEGCLVAFIAIDRSWEKDLPLEPTGELDRLRIFVEENMDICKWVAIAALTLLLVILLRVVVSERVDVSSDVQYGGRGGPHESLLNTQSGHTPTGDIKVTHSDIWSSRMREKYGLNNDETKHPLVNASSSTV